MVRIARVLFENTSLISFGPLISLFAGRAFFCSTTRRAGDVPMSRVKMNAKHEYEFLANYKVLQNHFKAHKLDKVRWFHAIRVPAGNLML